MSERGKLRKLLMRVTAVFMTIIMTCLTYAAAVLVSLCIPGKIIGIVNNSNYYSEQAACIEHRLEDITKKMQDLLKVSMQGFLKPKKL